MNCDRCKTTASTTKMSWFNTDALCEACQEQEEAHPDFAVARALEEEAVRRGDLNFPGVGWPGLDGRVVMAESDPLLATLAENPQGGQ